MNSSIRQAQETLKPGNRVAIDDVTLTELYQQLTHAPTFRIWKMIFIGYTPELPFQVNPPASKGQIGIIDGRPHRLRCRNALDFGVSWHACECRLGCLPHLFGSNFRHSQRAKGKAVLPK